MRLLTMPRAVVETLAIQQPDGLDFWRCLPFIRKCIPKNTRPTEYIAGRRTIPTVLIESDTPIATDGKTDLEIEGYQLFGVFVIEDRRNGTWLCGLDYFITPKE